MPARLPFAVVAVLASAISDLEAPGTTPEAQHRREQAHAWFRSGRDMLTVAALAGLDGRLIRQQYLAGGMGHSAGCKGIL